MCVEFSDLWIFIFLPNVQIYGYIFFPFFFQSALRQITDKAREFGADALFNQILPLLMSPTLEDQERHLLVKVIDRVLYKLDDLVRPYVHKVSKSGKLITCKHSNLFSLG